MKNLPTLQENNSDLTDYKGHLDFTKMLDRAVSLVSDQALLDEKGKTTLASIELTKAKVDNFLSSLTHVMEISHELELMYSEKDRFKRSDELDLLNSLRKQCTMHSKLGMRNMELAQEHLERIIESPEVETDEILKLQSVIDCNIDSTQKIIASVSRLIQLERYSGGRSWGKRKSSTNAITYIKGLKDEEDGNDLGGGSTRGQRRATRRISPAELGAMEAKKPYYEEEDIDEEEGEGEGEGDYEEYEEEDAEYE